ncbi:glycoside hydrolase family 3 C-terminal domain-containing protein [Amphibacillus sp. Q70]|uniref:glycoside hydrolase family 3 C-terminal domain-containing protein n=1 Tax=Amphibacillus sp. Q70 TaxID=3453416 RepID=UPI003F85DC82
MLEINMQDVLAVLDLIIPYLIGLGVVLLLAIVTIIAARKLSNRKKFMVRSQSGIAIFLAVIISLNLIAYGPMSTLLALASGEGSISEESGERAEELGEEIAAEGIVLLENDDDLLPIEGDSNLNVFGWSSTNPVYGGGGSGALSGTYETVSLLDGLNNAGLNVNEELSEFYTAYEDTRPAVEIQEQDWTLPEPPTDTYSEEMLENAREFSDQAMVVISRSSSEETDLALDASTIEMDNNSDSYSEFEDGMHYLELTQSEQDMLDLVTSNFDDVILVYNGANPLEMGFVEEYEEVKSVLWSPGPGQTGFNSLGQIVTGEVNPSGRTADTFAYDLTTTPYYNNFGDFAYDNVDEFAVEGDDHWGQTPTFVNYVEGIYVGYRFYETAAEEGLIDYNDTVQYPFGYGLSYSTFAQELGEINEDGNGNLTVDVTVTNTGDTAGKEVVQLYYTPPYTNGGLEKSAVNLIAFDKTDVIEPGSSQTVTLSFNIEDMASYDTSGDGAYVLEEGDYDISLRANSNEVVSELTYTLDETITYGGDNSRSTDEVTATNQFEHAEGDIEYLSRENGFANYDDVTAPPSTMSMSDEAKSMFINDTTYNVSEDNDPDAEMPVTGADNGMELLELRGADYDDEAWEPLLDQLTVEEMSRLIVLGGFQTQEIDSVGKVATLDVDGPASLNNNFTGVGSIGLPVALMLANTWSEELAYAYGDSMGEMAVEMGVSGWYAPGSNLHRAAFGGRNFEYYSEDPLLSGKIGANAVEAIGNYGVHSYIKHFALNEQETNRNIMITTWSDEQAIREIYLPSFELPIKEGGTTGVMSSFNYIGPEWAGASDALLNTVLRDEWGFRGTVLTDYFMNIWGYMDTDIMIRNGGDLALVAFEAPGIDLDDTESATAVQAMRQASKNILYTTVNSNAYSDDLLDQGMLSWEKVAIIINVIAAGIVIVLEVLTFRKAKNIPLKEES